MYVGGHSDDDGEEAAAVVARPFQVFEPLRVSWLVLSDSQVLARSGGIAGLSANVAEFILPERQHHLAFVLCQRGPAPSRVTTFRVEVCKTFCETAGHYLRFPEALEGLCGQPRLRERGCRCWRLLCGWCSWLRP